MIRFSFILLAIIFFNLSSIAKQVTVIDLHNQSIDQLLNQQQNNSENMEIDNNSQIDQENIDQNSNQIITSQEQDISINELSSKFSFGKKTNKEDLIFLFNNIKSINSPILKKELISILNLSKDNLIDFSKEDLDKIIIQTLLDLGNRKKAYQLIKSLIKVENIEYNNFYKEVEINYLLSNYNLVEVCEYRSNIKNEKLTNNDFFLKVDIFCLLLLEKYDEANLLYSLLNENIDKEDEYFYYLFNNLQNLNSISQEISQIEFDDKNIFLYSAMHRIGNIPLTEKFIEIDPISLSMPIILSSSTDIELRLKAAHLAFFNKLLDANSLAALYQTVDFTYEELNDPSNMLPILNKNIEIGMAYFFQLINIQILPITRLEAIIKFWNFAEKHELELVAYNLSHVNLNTIEPSNELSNFGAQISKSYVYSNDFANAEKWLLFSENSVTDPKSLAELNSSKLLYNLFILDKSENLINILLDNLKYMNRDLLNQNHEDFALKNEILNLIFNSLNQEVNNPYIIEKKIFDSRLMPSMYLINNIRSSVLDNNNTKLLLAIIASINNMDWSEIHPEHLSLIIMGLQKYEDGKILNDFILEILQQTNII